MNTHYHGDLTEGDLAPGIFEPEMIGLSRIVSDRPQLGEKRHWQWEEDGEGFVDIVEWEAHDDFPTDYLRVEVECEGQITGSTFNLPTNLPHEIAVQILRLNGYYPS